MNPERDDESAGVVVPPSGIPDAAGPPSSALSGAQAEPGGVRIESSAGMTASVLLVSLLSSLTSLVSSLVSVVLFRPVIRCTGHNRSRRL